MTPLPVVGEKESHLKHHLWPSILHALRNPGLHRDSFFLMVSTFTGVLGGFVYWKLLTLRFAAAHVGLASAAITSATFLGGLATLGLPIGLVRLMANKEPKMKAAMMAFSYLVTSFVSIIVGLVFLAGRGWWAPALLPDESVFFYGLGYVLLTLFLAILNINLGVLTAERFTPYLVVRNLVFSLFQILVVIFVPVAWGALGILLTSVLPNGVVALVILLINRRLTRTVGIRIDFSLVPLSELMRYSLGNQVFNLVWAIPAFVFPLITLHQLGQEANANLALTWTLYAFVAIIPSSTSSALLIEGSHNPSRLDRQITAALLNNVALLLPLTLVIIWLAPWLLGIFGPAYSGGSFLLRLLVLSSLPIAVNGIYLTLRRIRKQILSLNLLAALLTLGSVLLSFLFIRPFGLEGIGWGWLAGQSAFMFVALPLILRARRLVGADTG